MIPYMIGYLPIVLLIAILIKFMKIDIFHY